MDDLISDFVSECREMLDALGGEIVVWEANPGDRARLDSIFRFVHTVKGNCGFFDFPRLEALSHAAEDALADVRSGARSADPALVGAVLAVIDRIGEMVATIEAGEPLAPGDDSALVAALQPGREAAVAPVSANEIKASAAAPRTIRLSVELLDRVMSTVSDMVLARNELSRRLREAEADTTVDGAFERLSTIIADMREAITRTRMQRVENLFGALPRMVRDLSAELGKQVLIDIAGSDVELDREMIEMIRDPLTHIVRNAIDHGIEPPAERLRAGKREIGLLAVTARQSGNQILIDIADDGRGIDAKRLVDKAIAGGVLSVADAAAIGPRERLALIFEPGLSTADAVTNISGRGVGMDVVRANVERIGGAVELDSRPGEGTCVTLRVPLTLTIIPALTVSTGGQHFAIPRSVIEEIVRIDAGTVAVELIGGAALATIRGRRMPAIDLAALLGIDSGTAPADRTLVVLRLAGGDCFAVGVDGVHDHEELVIKPAAPAVMATGLYAGTTLADDGRPILLLDPAGIAERGGVRLETHRRGIRDEELADDPPAMREVPVLLVRGLDGRRRAVRLGVIDRIEEVDAGAVAFSAGRIRVRLGEAIVPLAGVPAGFAPEGVMRLLRLSDGARAVGYAIAEVIDLTAVAGDVIPAAESGEAEGVTLIDGEPTELLDAHWIFARHGDDAQRQPLLCRFASDDPWFDNVLRPMVEAAGYAVLGRDAAAVPDLTIAMDGGADPGDGAPTLWLRGDAEAAGARAGSIYRYDRDGLMRALRRGRAGR